MDFLVDSLGWEKKPEVLGPELLAKSHFLCEMQNRWLKIFGHKIT
jgi:hypothetical protein